MDSATKELDHSELLPDYYVGVESKYVFSKSVVQEHIRNDKRSTENEKKDDLTVNTSGNETKSWDSKSSKKNKRKFEREKHKDERLCPTLASNKPCAYGDTCRYNHDIQGYLSSKEKDINDFCPNYYNYGYCSYGLMCRFGDCHIDREKGINLCKPVTPSTENSSTVAADSSSTDDSKIQTDDKGFAKNAITSAQNNTSIYNTISRETQNLLRKKQYFKQNRNAEKAREVSVIASAPAPTPNLSSEYASNVCLPDTNTPVKLVDFSRARTYIAPLTTVGNLPFRRILKEYGADITCGEMAVAQNLEQGQSSEWALLRNHKSEDIFGIQLASSYADTMKRVCGILENETKSSFVDLNCGCPIDCMNDRGCGAALMQKPNRIIDIVKSMTKALPSRAVTVKLRIGWDDKNYNVHKITPMIQDISNGRVAAIFIHGRSRQQRYSRLANWEIVQEAATTQIAAWNTKCSEDSGYGASNPLIPIIGNGDVMSWDDWKSHQHLMKNELGNSNRSNRCDTVGSSEQHDALNEKDDAISSGLLTNCAMIGRGALVKPWVTKEINEQQTYDISASERVEMLRRFVHYGLEYWGSDAQGVSTTRRFLLEWLSFLHRYVPSGICYRPQTMNQRPPAYFGRDDMETLLSSPNCQDWIKISEMFLGKVESDFHFEPKHKSNSYPSVAVASINEVNNSVTPVV